MVDADHFKAVNDRHGHAAGDATLRALADRLRERLRTEDVAGRFGGEEFVIGLPDADAEGAAAVAEAVRAAVAARPLTIAGRELTLTVSVGWATWEDDDLGQLLARADGALYEAKAAGRDCVRPRADSPTMTLRGRRPRWGDMSLSSRTLLTTAALAAAVIAPSAANAAEGFTAVTSTGDVVQLHSDTASRADRRPQGHGPRRRREHRRPRPRADGRAARPHLGRQHRLGRPRHRQGDGEVPRAPSRPPSPPTPRVTFAVAPDGASARIITPGRDVVVNLADGRRHERPRPRPSPPATRTPARRPRRRSTTPPTAA